QQREGGERTSPERDLEAGGRFELARHHPCDRPHEGHRDHQEHRLRVRQATQQAERHHASLDARLRSCSFRWRLRKRMLLGVISTSSSSSMNSTPYSSVHSIGGVILIASSLPLTRKL